MMCSALKVLSWCGAMAGLIAGGLVAPAPSARAAGVLKVAMTAGDLPVTTGIQTKASKAFASSAGISTTP